MRYSRRAGPETRGSAVIRRATGRGAPGRYPPDSSRRPGSARRAWRVAPAASVCLLLIAATAYAAGTPQLVKNINPDPAGDSNPYGLTDVAGTLYFQANDGTHGYELWRSDGTKAGTTLVKDINPAGDSNPYGLTDVAGTLYFEADDGTHGFELWRSDGTRAGTTQVKDINPGGSSSPNYL